MYGANPLTKISGTPDNGKCVETNVDSEMAADSKKKGSSALVAVMTLAGIAGVAYYAYRRLSEKGEADVNDLLRMADRASQKLEDRIHEYAVAH